MKAVSELERFIKDGPLRTCLRHKEYKKGCKECFEINHEEDRDDLWHLQWERDREN